MLRSRLPREPATAIAADARFKLTLKRTRRDNGGGSFRARAKSNIIGHADKMRQDISADRLQNDA